MLAAFIFIAMIVLIFLGGMNAIPSVMLLTAALLYDIQTRKLPTGYATRSINNEKIDFSDSFDGDSPETLLSTAVGNQHYQQYENEGSGRPFSGSYSVLPEKALKDTVDIDPNLMYADIAQLYHYEDNPTLNDDKLSAASIDSGAKAKKSLDIRSHWNNNNVRRHFDYEMGIHEDAHREWWQDDDLELASKHVVI